MTCLTRERDQCSWRWISVQLNRKHAAMAEVVGHKYGPGNVDVDEVSSLFKRASGLVGGTADATPNRVISPAVGFNVNTLRFILVGLVSGNPQIQRYIVDHYVMSDVEFVLFCGATRGRDNYYHALRAGTILADYQVVFRDIVLSPAKAAVWVDLKVKPRLSVLSALVPRRTVPCVVLLHFAVDPVDGRTKVSLHHDHHSLFLLFWLGGVWSQQVAELFIRPIGGLMFVVSGKLLDTVVGLLQPICTKLGLPPSTPRYHVTAPTSSPALRSELAAAQAALHQGSTAAGTAAGTVGSTASSLDNYMLQSPAASAVANIDMQHGHPSVESLIRQATAEVAKSHVVPPGDVSAWDKFGFIGRIGQMVMGLWGLVLGLLLGFIIQFFAFFLPS